MLRPLKTILIISIGLTVLLYWVDIYILDPIAPYPGWTYRITNFLICLVMYVTLFFTVFSGIYYTIIGVRRLLKLTKRPL
ncbi:MAG: hypothetical protein EOP56_02230 [Sphingobacteriales bacterium]|nr:MAG: hypothetical protein EOP56_02230 [Sphingobacteriales bacterium]